MTGMRLVKQCWFNGSILCRGVWSSTLAVFLEIYHIYLDIIESSFLPVLKDILDFMRRSIIYVRTLMLLRIRL
jgi:hypothetical protein